MRPTVAAILSAIRGLLCLVSRRNTIVAGGHVLRECSKSSYGAGLRLILMPLGSVPVSGYQRRPGISVPVSAPYGAHRRRPRTFGRDCVAVVAIWPANTPL